MAPKKVVEIPKEPEPVEQPPPEPPKPTEDEISVLPSGLALPLRPKDILDIWALPGAINQAELVSKLLSLEAACSVAARREIVCDFHLFAIVHAEALCLSQRQAATFHAIMARILALLSEKVALQGCFKEFEKLLLTHTVEVPIFNAAEARSLADFATSTIFKHFLLHSFCLRSEQDSELLQFSVAVQRPPPPLPLSQATGLAARTNGRSRSKITSADDPVAVEDTVAAVEELSEEDEIEKLVQEKLKETEARLQARLDEREEAIQKKLAASRKA